jgi:BMFP domain-containing protein YqiC
MQSENRIFEDLSKIVNGAAGTIAGIGREVESNMREKAREWMGGLDFVSREEFDAVKAMAAAAREEVELLKARLDALEGKSPPSAPAPRKPTASATRKSAPKAG